MFLLGISSWMFTRWWAGPRVLLLLLLLLSRFSGVWLCVTPWTGAYQPPSSMGFSRQEYWSVVPLPSPRVPLGIFLKQKTILILLFQRSFHKTMKMAWNDGTFLGFILELQLAIGTRNTFITQSNLWKTGFSLDLYLFSGSHKQKF